MTTPFEDLKRLDLDYDLSMGYDLQLAMATLKYERLDEGVRTMGFKLKKTLQGEGLHKLEMRFVRDEDVISAVVFVDLGKTNAKLIVKTPDGQVKMPCPSSSSLVTINYHKNDFGLQTRSYWLRLERNAGGKFEVGLKSTEFEDIVVTVQQYVPDKVIKTDTQTTTQGVKASIMHGSRELAAANVMLEVYVIT